MRRLPVIVALAACASPPPAADPHEPKPVVAVLGLDAVPDDDATRAAAGSLTERLRAVASESFRLSPAKDTLAEMKRLASCPRDAASCMADIGSFLGVDFLIYGKLDRGVVSVDLLDVAKRYNRRTARLQLGEPAVTARAAMTQLGVAP